MKTAIKNGEGQVETVRPRLAEQGDQTCGRGGAEHEGQAERPPSQDGGQADKVRTFLVERYCPLDRRLRKLLQRVLSIFPVKADVEQLR